MSDSDKKIEELTQKLYQLDIQQQQLARELETARGILNGLRVADASKTEVAFPPLKELLESAPEKPEVFEATSEMVEATPLTEVASTPAAGKVKTPIEEFIGTNLLNKIGIAVLVFGVGVGAKYAIDHDLISPLTRIILGYLCGLVLTLLAIRLKPKYAHFSAVLLSGGLAVFYFITFAAYDLYQLIPQVMAFALMVLFTGFTVFASLQYNLPVVAIIGLVGAYAVPFLLSDGSGRVVILFSYMAIINTGILILAFKKAWKVLYYTAFTLTWIIFSAWFADQYVATEHIWISLTFSTIFFCTFYTTFLSYKLIQKEALSRWDIGMLMANSFLFYMWGYFAIDDHTNGDVFLGLFTLFNACLHFIACVIIFKRQDATKDTFYFVAGLVLVFLTMAVPVQLDGSWVTLIWAGETVILFWIGRTKNLPIYERLSYALIALTFISLLEDWENFYNLYSTDTGVVQISLFSNIQFFSSLLVCFLWGSILWVHYKNQSENSSVFYRLFVWGLPTITLFSLYATFFKEIDAFWGIQYLKSMVPITQDGYEYGYYDDDITKFQNLWIHNYTALFLLVLWIVNTRWIKNRALNIFTFAGSSLLLTSFVFTGLPDLSSLRHSFMQQTDAQYYMRGLGHLFIRYICLVLHLPMLWIVLQTKNQNELNDKIQKSITVYFHFILLALLSSELVSLLELSDVDNSDKLALSILWGSYALALIVYGLIRNKKFIRITAIGLFGITLLKLFFYDLSSMETIAKTIVLIILGALLLVASFLYNKFKPSEQ